MNDSNKSNLIQNEIGELHASTLEISKSSFEIKKLCITTIGIFNGFFLSKLTLKGDSVDLDDKLISIAVIISITITILFHITDATTYYYQRKNRKKQTDYKNEILINEKRTLLTFNDTNWFSSIFNMSMSMYMVIYGILIVIIHFNERNNITLSLIYIYSIICVLIIIYINHIKRKPKKIFVSYTIRDGKVDRESLKILSNLLKSCKFSCYIDLLHNNSLNAQEKVYRELLSSDIFLIIKTEKYGESEWTNKEFKIAKDTNKKIIEIDNHDISLRCLKKKIKNELKKHK
ncbi:toll/interleukin-1 receptor domain-containing protein [Providencia manganoxydans]|uniref:toll/interleukin-1 receptor domain-containing protein n=1 Tax=Providencia manganoxydans TaxID=2923283 RepID=UPI0032DA6C4C